MTLPPSDVVEQFCTAAVREALDARFALQELPAAAVAGISEPVVTYAVGSSRV